MDLKWNNRLIMIYSIENSENTHATTRHILLCRYDYLVSLAHDFYDILKRCCMHNIIRLFFVIFEIVEVHIDQKK